MTSVKSAVKNILVKAKLPLTRNIRYDIYTQKIMRRVLSPGSCAIDVGCHQGEILDEIRKFSPNGTHWAFEPLPHLYQFLLDKYKGMKIMLSPVALFDNKGTTEFNYVVNAPAYSGIRKRRYDIGEAQIDKLTVETDLLDNLIPENQKIDFIKIDVEGAEFGVLRGARKTIQRCKPAIIFEFGLGAADFYGSKPEEVFSFLTDSCGLRVSTLKGFLSGKIPLKAEQFCNHFITGSEYYFIAYNPR